MPLGGGRHRLGSVAFQRRRGWGWLSRARVQGGWRAVHAWDSPKLLIRSDSGHPVPSLRTATAALCWVLSAAAGCSGWSGPPFAQAAGLTRNVKGAISQAVHAPWATKVVGSGSRCRIVANGRLQAGPRQCGLSQAAAWPACAPGPPHPCCLRVALLRCGCQLIKSARLSKVWHAPARGLRAGLPTACSRTRQM